ncbi:hypothetical protein EPN16_03220 [bacterium]|nr:MAG: hypothetical protein EPN16_03220 [bacterium]
MAYLNNRAQALSELAVFGAVILGVVGFLLSYGMNANYSDNLNMQTFRYGLQKAYEAKDTYFNAQVIVMDYKSIPQPQGGNVVPSFNPLMASSSALLSNSLFMEMKDEDDFGNYTYLPKINLLIKDKSGKIGREFNFTTADWKEYDLKGVEVRERVDDENDTDPPDGFYWRWNVTAAADVKEGGSYDVDGDEKEESVIFYDASQEDKDGDGNDDDGKDDDSNDGIAKVIDSQEGEIDTSINSNDLRNDTFASQGLIGYRQEQRTQVRPGTYFEKTESPQSITSKWAVDMAQDFYHPIKLNRVTYKRDTIEADSVVEQMQAGDEIWIDINKDKAFDDGERFSKTELEAGGFEVYNGKEQDIILWINNKVVRNEGGSWSTPR